MQRYMYLSLIRPGFVEQAEDRLRSYPGMNQEALSRQAVCTMSVFRSDLYLCVYIDTVGDSLNFDWPADWGSLLQAWPFSDGWTSRLSVPMLDIFHDGVPSDPGTWYGGRSVEKRNGFLARLKPEQYSSYVYYHYQKQEEEPEEFNKTYLIGAHGTLIFSYSEQPAVTTWPKPHGKLDTRLRPQDWQNVMIPHFDPWPGRNGEPLYWKEMSHVFTLDLLHES